MEYAVLCVVCPCVRPYMTEKSIQCSISLKALKQLCLLISNIMIGRWCLCVFVWWSLAATKFNLCSNLFALFVFHIYSYPRRSRYVVSVFLSLSLLFACMYMRVYVCVVNRMFAPSCASIHWHSGPIKREYFAKQRMAIRRRVHWKVI